MPSSQAAATERRNERTVAPHEPPKLKTTLKTPPKQATNPLQFVKVGPCSLYRSAQEQLEKVQETKKMKQEVRDDPEDWQSNLDNWKSSRRKRQEHIIERVVEVKKLELEEHDRQRRRSKTFSEMMEERGSRGRKLSLAMYHEEDVNDLSDLGIGTSSGKSSVSGDTHDDVQSVTSDRDSEKNHSDVENANVPETSGEIETLEKSEKDSPPRKTLYGFDYDSGKTASSPEPEEYTYEGAIRGYVSRVSQNIPRLANLEASRQASIAEEKRSNNQQNQQQKSEASAAVKVDVPKRREMFERASRKNSMETRANNMNNNRGSSGDLTCTIKERLYNSDKQNSETPENERLSGDIIRERLSHLEHQQQSQKQQQQQQQQQQISNSQNCRKSSADESSSHEKPEIPSSTDHQANSNGPSENPGKSKIQQNKNSSIDERISSPEYRSRAPFHRSLDFLDVVSSSSSSTASSPQDTTFERVQSFEELDYTTRYPASSSSAEILNDTDREDSGIHTADVSCSVSQADEPVDEEVVHHPETIDEKQEICNTRGPFVKKDVEEIQERNNEETTSSTNEDTADVTLIDRKCSADPLIRFGATKYINKVTVPTSSCQEERAEDEPWLHPSARPVVYQSPRISRAERNNAESRRISESNVVVDEESEGSTKASNSPQESKRSVSKIPTALPRKNIKPALAAPSTPVRPLPKPKIPTKIPYSTIKCNEEIHPECKSDKRRADICEKVTVTHGELPSANPPPVAAPYVTVLRNNERNNEESNLDVTLKMESRDDEETIMTKNDSMLSHIGENRTFVEMKQEEPSLLCSQLMTSTMSDELGLDIRVSEVALAKQIPQLNLASNEELLSGFPLGPLRSVEPPKEKPPPPPTDLSDEENLPVEPLKRLNSTRRIKKELRTRRSDFLGIEGINDDYPELMLTKPPDIAAILAEERRVEQLNRRSYDTDSNYERDSSHERDSGVELGHDWSKQPVSPDMSEHSRQSSEPFGASVTSSEEDEITKKEREIIEVLEKEEQWRYDRELNSDIGEKLANKLRELEKEKMQLERERSEETALRRRQEEIQRMQEEKARKQEEDALREQREIARQQQQQQQEASERAAAEIAKRLEEQKIRDEENLRLKNEELRLQEKIKEEKERRSEEEARRQEEALRIPSMEMRPINSREPIASNNRNDDEFSSGEVLRVERELLQLEQEELKRRRTNVAYRQQRQLQLAEQLQEQWQSLQDVTNSTMVANSRWQAPAAPAMPPMNLRASMPNLWLQEGHRRRPPPIPTSKPARLVEQMQRDATIRNSRIPSADSHPIENGGSNNLATNGAAGQQMSKQTLHALSAVPRPRIVKGDEWVQRRKSDVPRGTLEYNYQHWLIQEAEQRRITEKNQRSVVRKAHVTGTSVPYTGNPNTRSESGKPLPDSIIQTLTQRVQNRAQERPPPQRRRLEHSASHEHLLQSPQHVPTGPMHQKVQQFSNSADSQEKMLSVSGKKKCSHCGDELGRGAAMIIESLRLFYHMECFKCCVCHVRLGDGLMGTDVRVRNHKLHCHNCYSSDDGVKFSCV